MAPLALASSSAHCSGVLPGGPPACCAPDVPTVSALPAAQPAQTKRSEAERTPRKTDPWTDVTRCMDPPFLDQVRRSRKCSSMPIVEEARPPLASGVFSRRAGHGTLGRGALCPTQEEDACASH